jgi:YHS domain-containing protein
MYLVPVASIPGYRASGSPEAVLSVPREAVLQTGERALVYVETEPGTYRATEVRIGPLAQGESDRVFYPILAGLNEGQKVVTRGNFVIDSQMHIAGKRSLLNAGGAPSPAHDHGAHGGSMEPTAKAPAESAVQTTCPVMGEEIDKDFFSVFRGVKVYFCCPGCDKKFLADPEKYIPNLPPAVQARIRRANTDHEGHDHG